MNKLSKILLVIIVILVIALSVMTYGFFQWREYYVSCATRMYEMIEELTNQENGYHRTSDGMVTVSMMQDSVTPTGAKIMITDYNEHPYPWREHYVIRRKENDAWKDIEKVADTDFSMDVYQLNENHQMEEMIDWSKYYGILQPGTYRIEKIVMTPISTIYFESDEFEIK